MELVDVGLRLRPLRPAGAGSACAGETGTAEPAPAVRSHKYVLGSSGYGPQGRGLGLPGKGILRAFQRFDFTQSGTRVRPATQRPAFSRLTAARRLGS